MTVTSQMTSTVGEKCGPGGHPGRMSRPSVKSVVEKQARKSGLLACALSATMPSMQAAAPTPHSPMLTALCCDLCGSTDKQQPGSGVAADSVIRAWA